MHFLYSNNTNVLPSKTFLKVKNVLVWKPCPIRWGQTLRGLVYLSISIDRYRKYFFQSFTHKISILIRVKKLVLFKY
jgi:hypothetical protein